MADSADPLAILAPTRQKLESALRNLKVAEQKLKNSEINKSGGRKDVVPSPTSFKRDCAVHQSRLLSIAPEIRNMIWKLCLFHPDDLITKIDDQLFRGNYGCFTMTIDSGCSEARPKLLEAYGQSVSKRTMLFKREHSPRNLALMQTCQDVYNETAPMLWSQRFYFHSIMHLQAFLFSKARLDLVRDIFVWNLDRQSGVNYMPAVSALLADKVQGLDRFDIDMSSMAKTKVPAWPQNLLRNSADIRAAGVKLGFDVYSCMHPWVTKVVREQGIEKLMAILQIPRETRSVPDGNGGHYSTNRRTHEAFKNGGKLHKIGQKMADTATAGEILRLINLYDM